MAYPNRFRDNRTIQLYVEVLRNSSPLFVNNLMISLVPNMMLTENNSSKLPSIHYYSNCNETQLNGKTQTRLYWLYMKAMISSKLIYIYASYNTSNATQKIQFYIKTITKLKDIIMHLSMMNCLWRYNYTFIYDENHLLLCLHTSIKLHRWDILI